MLITWIEVLRMTSRWDESLDLVDDILVALLYFLFSSNDAVP